MKGTVVVMPAFNEERSVASVTRSVLEQNVELVIVVDDGSTDATCRRVKDTGVDLVVHSENLGKGAALSSGFRRALESGATRVISIDADDQHRPKDISRLEAMSLKHPEAIVIAARMHGRGEAPPLRRFGNAVADFWISWASGQRIQDTQSGYRLYPSQVLRSMSLPSGGRRGFVYESEILIDASQKGTEIRSVAIDTRYLESSRSSHYRPWRDTWGIVSMVAGRLLRKGMYPMGLLRTLGVLSPSYNHRNVSSHSPR